MCQNKVRSVFGLETLCSHVGNNLFPRWEYFVPTLGTFLKSYFNTPITLLLHVLECTFFLVEVLQDIESLLGSTLVRNDSFAVKEILCAMQLAAR